MEPIRVAVIGAGAAGLVALRHLTARPQMFKAVAYEQTGNVGGTWVFNEKTGIDDYGLPVHSSMYQNMRTNLPKEVMAFPDFPFDKSLPSFVGHEDVRSYLESYTSHFSLRDYIKFFTIVDQVKPKKFPNGRIGWDVTTKSVKQPDLPGECGEFDAVITCNGHYSLPLIPDIPGLDTFQGQVMHSHDYRHEQVFKDKRVIVLGAGASGLDISLELAKCAKMVILSHNKNSQQSPLPTNVSQSPGIVSVKETSVVLRDGQELEVDTILLCTGYKFSFPFLSQECAVDIDDERLTPLYKHLIHTTYPSLCFIGIVKTVCPFPLFHNQVKLFLTTLDGSVRLPSKEEMDLDTAQDFEERLESGLPPRHAHHMGTRQWGYSDSLADIGHFERIPPVVNALYDAVHDRRATALQDYKGDKYELLDDKSYKII